MKKTILSLNCGSSSLKFNIFNINEDMTVTPILNGIAEEIGNIRRSTMRFSFNGEKCKYPISLETHEDALTEMFEVFLKNGIEKESICAVGHRIVQGAELFTETCIITDEIIDQIDNLAELAPVHNHAHALALRACKSVLPENVPQVAVFDTAFHQTIPPKAYMYAIPFECYEKYSIRKYGFHGTSHRYVSIELAKILNKKPEELKIVSCHLGNGSSITAINGGKSIDTSMGFTPLDGLIMGTRCGSIDASAVTYMQSKLNLTPEETSDMLNKRSGFLGLSGISSDNRDISNAAEEGNERAILIAQILQYEIQKYIGSYAAAMNGLDAIIFTGGIGENDPALRAGVGANMSYFGIEINQEVNALIRGKLSKISTENSKVEVWVVPTNEELLIARDTLEIINK